MKLKSQIPNFLTLSNLICGVLSIAATASGNPFAGAIFILSGAFLDFFDGLAARALRVQGPMGRELDSLADVVSFGAAPTFIALYYSGGLPLQWYAFPELLLVYTPLLIAAAAAYRLAKFNLDTRQSESFIGMPTPANALLWLSFPLMEQGAPGFLWEWYERLLLSPLAIALLSLFSAALMVSELKLMSLKFKSFAFGANAVRYALLALSAALLAFLSAEAIPIILLLYIALSRYQNRTNHGIQSRD